MKIYFALVQNSESGEYHIRRYKMIESPKKDFIPLSNDAECGEIIDEKFTTPVSCKWTNGKMYKYFPETSMRHVCDDVGRKVCGQCVSTLYTTQSN